MSDQSSADSKYLEEGTVLHGASYDYTIERVLGHGSFGVTYLASVKLKGALGQLATQAHVAIKEFFLDSMSKREGSTLLFDTRRRLIEDYRKKFKREAGNLAMMDHEGIVKVLESFDENGTSYFVMDYVDGPSLDAYIRRRGRIAPENCAAIIRSLALALREMHSRSMLHLDIKPANIMLRSDGRPVLIDFGLSKCFEDDGTLDTRTMIGNGTSGYAPIEQSDFSGSYDGHLPATMDIYALGATMYKMLSGCRPPEASVVLNDGFPEAELESLGSLRAIVEKAMEPVIRRRYSTVDELLAALPEGTPLTAADIKAGGTDSGDNAGDDPHTPELTELPCIRNGRYIWDYLQIEFCSRYTDDYFLLNFADDMAILKLRDWRERNGNSSMSFKMEGQNCIPESLRKYLGTHPDILVDLERSVSAAMLYAGIDIAPDSGAVHHRNSSPRCNADPLAMIDLYEKGGLHEILLDLWQRWPDSSVTIPESHLYDKVVIKICPPRYTGSGDPYEYIIRQDRVVYKPSIAQPSETVISPKQYQQFLRNLTNMPFRYSGVKMPLFGSARHSDSIASVEISFVKEDHTIYGCTVGMFSLYEEQGDPEYGIPARLIGGNVRARFSDFVDYLHKIIPQETKGGFFNIFKK